METEKIQASHRLRKALIIRINVVTMARSVREHKVLSMLKKKQRGNVAPSKEKHILTNKLWADS